MSKEAKTIVQQELAETRKQAQIQDRTQVIVSENQALLEDEGEQYRTFALDVNGRDGYSPLGRLLAFGNPITGEDLTPKTAYEFYLGMQSGTQPQGDRVAFLAQPSQSTIIKEESGLTDEMMNKMSDTEVALRLLETRS